MFVCSTTVYSYLMLSEMHQNDCHVFMFAVTCEEERCLLSKRGWKYSDGSLQKIKNGDKCCVEHAVVVIYCTQLFIGVISIIMRPNSMYWEDVYPYCILCIRLHHDWTQIKHCWGKLNPVHAVWYVSLFYQHFCTLFLLLSKTIWSSLHPSHIWGLSGFSWSKWTLVEFSDNDVH